MKPTTQDLLKNTQFFAGLSNQSIHRLEQSCRSIAIQSGEFLFFQDEPGESLYLLVTGAMRLHKSSADGRDVVIKTVQPGEIFAEVILFESPTYPVTAAATANSTLLALRRTSFLALLDEPAFRNEFISTLFRKMRYMTAQLQERATQDPSQRLVSWIRQHYGNARTITLPVSKKEVAQAINVTPETLSRALLKLKNQGRMVWIRNQIVFGNEELLPDKR